MAVSLKINVANAGSFLLTDAPMWLTQDGKARPFTSGWNLLDPPTGGGSVIEFTMVFKLTVAGVTRNVLTIQMKLILTDTDLAADAWTRDGGKTWIAGRHPLVFVNTAEMATTKTATIDIASFFVDLTETWWALHGTNRPQDRYKAADEYRARHPTDAEGDLKVLGYTGGKPLLWFASVPPGAYESEEVSALVFFRPGTYPYEYDLGGLQSPRHRAIGMYQLSRFLLAPKGPPSAGMLPPDEVWKVNRLVLESEPDPAPDPKKPKKPPHFYPYICAGFEQALKRSSAGVVMLTPWPHDLDGGVTVGGGLRSTAYVALLLLYVMGRIRRGVTSPYSSLFKFGLMGFSEGGDRFWQALTANSGDVDEVYAFDPNMTRSGTRMPPLGTFNPAAVLKANAERATSLGRENRTHLVWGMNTSLALAREITKTFDDRKPAGATMTFHPPNEEFWDFPTQTGAGRGAWWRRVHSTFTDIDAPANRKFVLETMRHQFTVFGGRILDPVPADSVTFFEEFLEGFRG
jgi:hypothetical protein